MRVLFEGGYNDTDWLVQGVTNIGFDLERDDKILDFGCGAGGMVYGFRDRGFDARGFDIHRYVSLRTADDARFFRFHDGLTPTNSSDTRFDPAAFRIPYDDDSFDLVFSTSTIEHVTDLDAIMREIARVLKPGGATVHLYPSDSVPIEPHIFVPLGARIQTRWWFYIWAALGVRNSFQRRMTAAQAADNNLEYCASGLRYWTRNQLQTCASRYFSDVSFPKERFQATARNTIRGDLRNVWRALRGPQPFADLAALPLPDCMLCARKRLQV